ncbi:MAG: 50S ribosomal protein L11 methyltransferase [Paludibacteraceae bacterium]|nr:50S ribosomal protein L11 methyltransferase [Paludibacteraceae bacterium]
MIHIKTSFKEEWQKDVFDQTLCNYGVDTIDGENYYIPSEVWAINSQRIMYFCVMHEDDGSVHWEGVEECPDENWNAVWESEHPVQELPLGIRIIPHCAFGAGYHETTSMMIDYLQQSAVSRQHSVFRKVLDHGTGTGVLAIFAKRLGAEHVVAVDIDEKSVANAKENAALNGEEIEVLHASAFSRQPSAFSLILANIHRNILLEYMPSYAASLTTGGELWMSGFYEEDCPVLIEAAAANGLRHLATHAKNEWRMLMFGKTINN